MMCSSCGLPIDVNESGIRHRGFSIAHSENRCIQLLQARIDWFETNFNVQQILISKIQAVVHEVHGQDERWSDFDVLDQGVHQIVSATEKQVAEDCVQLAEEYGNRAWNVYKGIRPAEEGFERASQHTEGFSDGAHKVAQSIRSKYGLEEK